MGLFINIRFFLTLKVIRSIALLLFMLWPSSLMSQNIVTLKFAFSNSSTPLSYSKNGQAAGLLTELVAALFETIPNYQHEASPYPWNRAQIQVESGASDLFVTYPSSSRQQYALFSSPVLFELDYGYLIYHKDNKNHAIIQGATSFEDLKNLLFVSQQGTAWEVDNIPPYIQRVFSMSEEAILLNVLKRQAGDFLVMPPEEATHLARKNGLGDVLGIQKVSFIPNSLIPFQIGISKKHPNAEHIISVLNEYQIQDDFLKIKDNILAKYR